LARFPEVATLAAAREHDVLRHWEGLGYYRRSRQMHRAARLIVDEHGGQFPREPDALRRLPGIGRYTAGAILSIAFEAREPILEGNTQRLLSRLLGYRGDPRSSAGQRLLWSTAAALLPRRGVGAFNQALMELGALVCTPRAPRCGECPVVNCCRAAQLSLQHELPARSTRPRVEFVRQAAVVVFRQGKVLLVKRTEPERWAGMWDFPRFELSGTGRRCLAEITSQLRAETGVSAEIESKIATLHHTVTRFKIQLDCFRATCEHTPSSARSTRKLKWATPRHLANLALSATGRKLARLIDGPPRDF
jgi:A/G-specific adenine glycosylase